MLRISRAVAIPDGEIEFNAIRARGPGGQHVNKVASAIQLRFDIASSSLPDCYKERLLTLNDRRISGDGVLVIKARQYRSQERNREAALERFRVLIRSVGTARRRRIPTCPTRAAHERRLSEKNRHGLQKRLRRRVNRDQDG